MQIVSMAVNMVPDTRFLSFGEAMLRYSPANGHTQWRGQCSAAAPYVQSVGGDELNVCVALARLGCDASWVSVLPAGPLGEIVHSCAAEAGVNLDHVILDEGGDLGTYHVLPEENRVHYQRKHSAFCLQRPGLFDWSEILKERCRDGSRAWLHLSGITPMLGNYPAASWCAAILAAAAAGSPVSVDLNYIPQLGPFDRLWSTVGPLLRHIHLLILSVHSSHELAEHLGVNIESTVDAEPLHPIPEDITGEAEETKNPEDSRPRIPESCPTYETFTDQDGGESQMKDSSINEQDGSAKSEYEKTCEKPLDERAEVNAGVPQRKDSPATKAVAGLLSTLCKRINGPALACCLKERDASGRQKRWSIIVDGNGMHSTEHSPVFHVPKDECGGGSAWAAGVIHCLSQELAASERPALTRLRDVVSLGPCVTTAARRGDILAALAQETMGDHSIATRRDLDAAETQASASTLAQTDGQRDILDCATSDSETIIVEPGVLPCDNGENTRVVHILKELESAKIIPVLRVKNEARALERASELVDLGYQAIEVAADSVGFAEGRLMPAFTKAIGDRCLVGVSAVTTLEQLEIAARGGAKFIVSPVRPTIGWGDRTFVEECHKRGVLAMPSAFSPQEIYEAVECHGAFAVRIFPAQLWSPSALSDLRHTGDFGQYRFFPSGSITWKTAEEWLKAGASGVAMGSCLVGKDVSTKPEDTLVLHGAERDWQVHSKPTVAAFAKRLGLTTSSC